MEYQQLSIIEEIFFALFKVASRRTSLKFAEDAIVTALDTLKKKYFFLKNAKFKSNQLSKSGVDMYFSSEINSVHKSKIADVIESLIRIVYNDLDDDAGLYFISEMKEFVGEKIVQAIREIGVDLDQIQIEQHHAYLRKIRKNKIKQGNQEENLLGYSWKEVSRWEHKDGSNYCTIFDNTGNVLDRINLDRVIQNYVETLSGIKEPDPIKLEKMVRLYEREYSLLKLMCERDMDVETASNLLKISKDELNKMVQKLLEMEMLQFISENTVKLTETGLDAISRNQNNRNQKKMN
jgi:hypothetical protein